MVVNDLGTGTLHGATCKQRSALDELTKAVEAARRPPFRPAGALPERPKTLSGVDLGVMSREFTKGGLVKGGLAIYVLLLLLSFLLLLYYC